MLRPETMQKIMKAKIMLGQNHGLDDHEPWTGFNLPPWREDPIQHAPLRVRT